MAKLSPLVNGDEMSINITKNEFSSSQDKCVKLYSCDFDHMYASVNDNNAGLAQDKDKEIKHLNDLLLVNLDLIQQQSEQIVTKDKQLAALRQEYETLKMRFQRMERRVTLQKHKDVTATEEPPTPSNTVIEQPLISETDATKKTCLTVPIAVREEVAQNTVRSPVRGCKRRASVGTSGRRKPRQSYDVQLVENIKQEDQLDFRKDFHESESPVKSSKERFKLKTSQEYYTIVGEERTLWAPVDRLEGSPDLSTEQVQVPSWREKLLTPSYSMEGTENLDDEVFNRRHHRLQVDERRRKRWDIQRMREQNQIDKLKERERKQRRSSGGGGGDNDKVTSYYPVTEDLQEILIEEDIPVIAFGMQLPVFEHSEFSLTWSMNRGCTSMSSKKKTS